MSEELTDRERAKADRYDAILRAAARLFAERGYGGVTLEDLGGAVGITGPGLYRHFSGKQALLSAILVRISETMLRDGHAVVARSDDPDSRLRGLISFHVERALGDPDVIRVQDRDLTSLSEDDQRTVRRLQHDYVELWVAVLAERLPGTGDAELWTRAHACFGLMNSTPYTLRAAQARHATDTQSVLEKITYAALTA